MACVCTIRKALTLGFFLLLAASFAAWVSPLAAASDPTKSDLTVDTSGGYARLVFAMSDDIDASVHLSGNVLIVNFNTPISVSVDRLSAQAPDYIAAAQQSRCPA
jgi:hypothetical protein